MKKKYSYKPTNVRKIWSSPDKYVDLSAATAVTIKQLRKAIKNYKG